MSRIFQFQSFHFRNISLFKNVNIFLIFSNIRTFFRFIKFQNFSHNFIFCFFSHTFPHFFTMFLYTFPHILTIFHKYSYIFIFIHTIFTAFHIFPYLPIFFINIIFFLSFLLFQTLFHPKFHHAAKFYHNIHNFFLRDFKNIYQKNVHLIIMT